MKVNETIYLYVCMYMVYLFLEDDCPQLECDFDFSAATHVCGLCVIHIFQCTANPTLAIKSWTICMFQVFY